jgi:hypothetical protein
MNFFPKIKLLLFVNIYFATRAGFGYFEMAVVQCEVPVPCARLCNESHATEDNKLRPVSPLAETHISTCIQSDAQATSF